MKYLRRVVPVLLEEEDDVPETFNKALQDRQYLENIKKFISDPQVRGKEMRRSAVDNETYLASRST